MIFGNWLYIFLYHTKGSNLCPAVCIIHKYRMRMSTYHQTLLYCSVEEGSPCIYPTRVRGKVQNVSQPSPHSLLDCSVDKGVASSVPVSWGEGKVGSKPAFSTHTSPLLLSFTGEEGLAWMLLWRLGVRVGWKSVSTLYPPNYLYCTVEECVARILPLRLGVRVEWGVELTSHPPLWYYRGRCCLHLHYQEHWRRLGGKQASQHSPTSHHCLLWCRGAGKYIGNLEGLIYMFQDSA